LGDLRAHIDPSPSTIASMQGVKTQNNKKFKLKSHVQVT